MLPPYWHERYWNKLVPLQTQVTYEDVLQVVTLRTVHEKLLLLLSGGRQQALTSERVFQPFSGLNPLHYNPYTEVKSPSCCFSSPLAWIQPKSNNIFLQPLWRAAVAQFERLMTPSEQEVAGKLKGYIADVQDNPQQVAQGATSALESVSDGSRVSLLMLCACCSSCCWCFRSTRSWSDVPPSAKSCSLRGRPWWPDCWTTTKVHLPQDKHSPTPLHMNASSSSSI